MYFMALHRGNWLDSVVHGSARVIVKVKLWFGSERAGLQPVCRARNVWYFGSKCYHVFSFATGILMW